MFGPWRALMSVDNEGNLNKTLSGKMQPDLKRVDNGVLAPVISIWWALFCRYRRDVQARDGPTGLPHSHGEHGAIGVVGLSFDAPAQCRRGKGAGRKACALCSPRTLGAGYVWCGVHVSHAAFALRGQWAREMHLHAPEAKWPQLESGSH